MKDDIRIFLIDACGWIISITIIVFFFTLWLFSYTNVESSLKEAWSVTFSAFSAMGTIGAAIIAAFLFNDWKEVHSTQSDTEDAKKLQNTIFSIKALFDNELNFIEIHSIMNNSKTYKEQAKINIEELQKRYWPLKVDMAIQISIFNNNALNGLKIIESTEEKILQHYFYTIITLLESIYLGKHESNKPYFKGLLNHCKNEEKIIFDNLIDRINNQLLRKIKPN